MPEGNLDPGRGPVHQRGLTGQEELAVRGEETGTRPLGSLLTARGKRDDRAELPGRVLPAPGEPGRPS
ncbi:hypothetical protein OG333_01905 [Streptomyces anulatus]|uniref:hypothetical protein n=1 Tax=Streptomyces anulatus TaxID=1892 RepID=UPI00386D1587|nr:hypothetical protein OG333_01905 [Streptomyces anulatus]